ncbi:hypothetical protein ACOMHN_043690 [Nucella lapillus]
MSQADYTCTLSPEMLKKAQEELHEDPNTRHLEIKTLRERLEQVPGYKGRTDSGFLLRFLRCKKFEQERAFKQVVTYYNMRKDNPDVYENLTPKRVRHVLDEGVMAPLKDRAPDGSRMIFFRPGRWDPSKATIPDVLGNNFLTLSKIIEDEETQVCGVTMIADLKDMGWEQAKNISPFYARKIATLLQEAFPARFRGIHYVNEPTFFNMVFAVLKQFLKAKFLDRVYLYGNKLEKLHEKFPREILPEDLKGTQPAFDAQEWITFMTGCVEQFVSECEHCSVNIVSECEHCVSVNIVSEWNIARVVQEWITFMTGCEEQFVEDNKLGIVDLTIPAKGQKKADATEALGGTFRKLNVD